MDYFIDTATRKQNIRPNKIKRKRRKAYTKILLAASSHRHSNNKVVREKPQIAVYRV